MKYKCKRIKKNCMHSILLKFINENKNVFIHVSYAFKKENIGNFKIIVENL